MELGLPQDGQELTLLPRQQRKRALRTQAAFTQFVAILARIQSNREWYAGAALSQKLVRTLLWELITDDTLLFQAAIFVAGTYSNTCGVSSAALQLGPALAVLRGASLRALRETAQYAENTSFKTASVALLAGWEKKFGDAASYSTHMTAWKALPLPDHALEESYVLTLLDVTFEAFREGLDEQAGLEYSVLAPWTVYQQAETTPLPRGFADMTSDLIESKSLLAIAARIIAFDPYHEDSVSTIRKLCIESIAWSPSHTKGVIPLSYYEESHGDLHLNALYHIRAACVSLTGFFLRIASNHHEIRWVADIEGALYAHAVSCRHLPTEALMGTAYQDIALWSRFLIRVAGRNPDPDPIFRRLINRSNVRNFEELELLFSNFIYHRAIFRDMCWDVYSNLMDYDGT